MAVRQDQRRIFFYEIVSRARARHARPASARELCDAWKTVFDAKAARHERENGDIVFRLGDISIDQSSKTACLLIRRGDENAADATFSKKEGAGKLRVVAKEHDELGDVAAHIVLSLVPQHNRPDTYLLVLEQMPGIGHHVVRAVLNAFLKRASDLEPNVFSYPSPAGARDEQGALKLKAFVPTIELRGLPSADLLRDIERGKVHGIDLIKSMQQANLGGDSYLEEEESIIKVKLASGAPKTNLIQRIVSAAKAEKLDHREARIRFADESGKSSSVSFSLDTGSVEQDRYVRNELLTALNPGVPQSSESIVKHLAQRMTDAVTTNRKAE